MALRTVLQQLGRTLTVVLGAKEMGECDDGGCEVRSRNLEAGAATLLGRRYTANPR